MSTYFVHMSCVSHWLLTLQSLYGWLEEAIDHWIDLFYWVWLTLAIDIGVFVSWNDVILLNTDEPGWKKP